MRVRWNEYFMDIAQRTSEMSKDPSTKVGAVLVSDRRVVGTGFNGFPEKITDHRYLLLDRGPKLARMIHAEMNALLYAGREARGSALYMYGFDAPPCSRCTVHLIQAGVAQVYARGPAVPERWREDFELSAALLKEADVPFLRI